MPPAPLHSAPMSQPVAACFLTMPGMYLGWWDRSASMMMTKSPAGGQSREPECQRLVCLRGKQAGRVRLLGAPPAFAALGCSPSTSNPAAPPAHPWRASGHAHTRCPGPACPPVAAAGSWASGGSGGGWGAGGCLQAQPGTHSARLQRPRACQPMQLALGKATAKQAAHAHAPQAETPRHPPANQPHLSSPYSRCSCRTTSCVPSGLASSITTIS